QFDRTLIILDRQLLVAFDHIGLPEAIVGVRGLRIILDVQFENLYRVFHPFHPNEIVTEAVHLVLIDDLARRTTSSPLTILAQRGVSTAGQNVLYQYSRWRLVRFVLYPRERRLLPPDSFVEKLGHERQAGCAVGENNHADLLLGESDEKSFAIPVVTPVPKGHSVG